MKYLLDTNTCVHYLRFGSNSTVAGKLAATNPGDVALCSVVLGELLFGALRSSDPVNNSAQVRTFAGGIPSLPFDDDAADRYAEIRADLAAKGTPIGPNDIDRSNCARTWADSGSRITQMSFAESLD